MSNPRHPTRMVVEIKKRPPVLLGSAISEWLSKIGITEESVSNWLGRGCGCAGRRKKLDRLSLRAAYVLRGETPPPDEELDKMIEAFKQPPQEQPPSP